MISEWATRYKRQRDRGWGASLLNVKEEFKTRLSSSWVSELNFLRIRQGSVVLRLDKNLVAGIFTSGGE
jgi:hypothetical protein